MRSVYKPQWCKKSRCDEEQGTGWKPSRARGRPRNQAVFDLEHSYLRMSVLAFGKSCADLHF